MGAHITLLLYEGGVEGCYCKSKSTKSTKNLQPTSSAVTNVNCELIH